ncbi:Myblike DNAbinding domain-containing protein [Entomortierella beljakovae]|nr:Myblike DNAbinding domain-containing protein [Entomortierella beljakovae]
MRRFLPSASRTLNDITLSKNSSFQSSHHRISNLYFRSPPFLTFSSSSRIGQISIVSNDITAVNDSQENVSGTDDATLDDEITKEASAPIADVRVGIIPTKKPVFTPEIDAEIIRFRRQNLSWATIGSKLGIPYRSCNRRYNTILDPGLNEHWSDEKLQRLEDLVAEGKSWLEISKSTGMSVSSCQVKWRMTTRPEGSNRNRVFDVVQSRVLMNVVKEHGEGDWKFNLREFMKSLGGRDMAKITPLQLKHQYYNLQRKPQHTWSLDEETLLIQHVLKHGMREWELISEKVQSHTPEQCKDKWLELDMKSKEPKTRAWYKNERGSFWRLYKIYGDNWTEIASQLKKRTPDNCKQLFERETTGLSREDPVEFERKVKEIAEERSKYVTLIWKKQDSDRLWEVVERNIIDSKNNRADWTKIAEEMGMGLSPDQYKHHHYYLRLIKKNGGLSGAWTKEDVQTLEKAVRELGHDWSRISREYLPNRNGKSLCHKYNSIRNKGAYITSEEYETLLSSVDRQEAKFRKGFGDATESTLANFTPDWKKIAKLMPGGSWTPEQCKDAYKSSFKNHLKNSTWTAKQDQTLLDMVKTLGRKNWIGIALRIPEKDTWECRLRWAELQDPTRLKAEDDSSIDDKI